MVQETFNEATNLAVESLKQLSATNQKLVIDNNNPVKEYHDARFSAPPTELKDSTKQFSPATETPILERSESPLDWYELCEDELQDTRSEVDLLQSLNPSPLTSPEPTIAKEVRLSANSDHSDNDDILSSQYLGSEPEKPPYTLVHSIDTLLPLLEVLGNLSKDQGPSVYLDLEGRSLGRNGSISVLQLYLPPAQEVYLVDVLTLGKDALSVQNHNGLSLKYMLESPDFFKVFFDVRSISDALYNLCDIRLGGVIDLQLMEVATRTFSKKFVRGLAKCVGADSTLLEVEKSNWLEAKQQVRQIVNPGYGGDDEALDRRPLGSELSFYLVQDVTVLKNLWEVYSSKISPALQSLVLDYSSKRIQVSQRADYEGQGPHMALSFWNSAPALSSVRPANSQKSSSTKKGTGYTKGKDKPITPGKPEEKCEVQKAARTVPGYEPITSGKPKKKRGARQTANGVQLTTPGKPEDKSEAQQATNNTQSYDPAPPGKLEGTKKALKTTNGIQSYNSTTPGKLEEKGEAQKTTNDVQPTTPGKPEEKSEEQNATDIVQTIQIRPSKPEKEELGTPKATSSVQSYSAILRKGIGNSTRENQGPKWNIGGPGYPRGISQAPRKNISAVCPCENQLCSCKGYPRHPEHKVMHWTKCYDDDCIRHYQSKMDSFFPKKPLDEWEPNWGRDIGRLKA